MNIWMAASDGELETVKAFLATGGDANMQDENGYTPLCVHRLVERAGTPTHLVTGGGRRLLVLTRAAGRPL